MRYEMLYDRLLVRPIAHDKRTKGGLYVPDMVTDGTPWFRGEVVAVGHGRVTQTGDTVPLKVVVGDVVCFYRHPPEQMAFPGDDGVELMCICERHVMAVLRDLPQATSLVSVEGETLVMPS